jgi:GABA(A) receptor-associated protein
MSKFKAEYSFEERKSEALRVLNKYSERIPVICEQMKNGTLDNNNKKKFLVPNDLSIGQFLYVLRKRIKLNENQALFLFINNTLAPMNDTFQKMYNTYKDDDLFLYIIYSQENTFG